MNTVDPDPDYQQRLIKVGDYHLQLAMQCNDLAERNKTLTRETTLNKDTINQLNWQLSETTQDCEAEHFKGIGLQEDLDRLHEQLRIERATARNVTTLAQAAI